MTSDALAVAVDPAASGWWQRHFGAFGERIPFKALFFPLLLQACDGSDPTATPQQQQQLSQDELAALVRHCVAEDAWTRGFVTRRDFLLFVARFGPLELTIAKVVSCFCVNGELVPWFHGLLGRAEADRVLAAPQTTIGDGASSPTSKARGSDGTFLVRFSESHPTKFTLSYVKIHTSGPHVGRREMKNCLIENLGRQGYALTDSKARTFSSILSFVQRSAGRLKYGVPSEVAKHCNSELAEIRAVQDRLSNSYTAFSAETLEMTSEASPSAQANRSLLFSQSPPRFSTLQQVRRKVSTGGEGNCCADSYSGFTLDALTAPLQVKTKSVASTPSSLLTQPAATPATECGEGNDAYCEVGHFFGGPPEKENNQLRHNEPVAGSFKSPPQQQSADAGADYGSFISFAGASMSSPVPTLGSPAAAMQFKQLSPSSRPPRSGFAPLLSPARRLQQLRGESSLAASQDDEYATFESFASTFAGESEELARRNGLTMSFAKGALGSSAASTASLASASSFGTDDTYGSFASLSVTKPSLGSTTSGGSGEDTYSSAVDYGDFASLVGSQDDGGFELGPPPPPPTPLRFAVSTSFGEEAGRKSSGSSSRSFAQRAQVRQPPANSDVYGSFAALASSSPTSSPDISSDSEPMYGNFQSSSAAAGAPFPFVTKTKEVSVLAQAGRSTSFEKAQVQLHQPHQQELPRREAHAHSAACSALEELNAGMVCYQQKQLDEALARFIHAQEVAKATDDKVVEARALGNLGTVYLDMKNAAQAVMCYQRCLDITRSIKDSKRERTILNNLVLALMASEEFERALACCEIQLEMTTNEINRRKIFSRMSLLREKAARAKRERNAAALSSVRSL